MCLCLQVSLSPIVACLKSPYNFKRSSLEGLLVKSRTSSEALVKAYNLKKVNHLLDCFNNLDVLQEMACLDENRKLFFGALHKVLSQIPGI